MVNTRDSKDRSIRIAFRLQWKNKAAREIGRGVLRYAATHPHMQVEFCAVHDASGDCDFYRRWMPDGVIGDSRWIAALGSVKAPQRHTPEALLRALHAAYPSCRAAVFMHTAAPRDPEGNIATASVVCDHAAVARAALDLFLRRGLRHLGYVGSRVGRFHYDERAGFFVDAALAAGATVSVYHPLERNRDWGAEEARLARWLGELPKPCGVMAVADARAKQVLDVCRACGVAVPEQVQVCGVDDEEWICEQTVPSLTSVEPDFERGGFLAAEALDALLHGRTPHADAAYGVRGVVERLSTQDAKGTARLVLRAQEFIRMHTSSPIVVADVAKAAGCSQRLLEDAFRSVLGSSPVKALQEARTDRARTLLERTTTPISQIPRLCGVASGSHLKVIFHRRFGCTMQQWRTRFSPAEANRPDAPAATKGNAKGTKK